MLKPKWNIICGETSHGLEYSVSKSCPALPSRTPQATHSSGPDSASTILPVVLVRVVVL